MRCVICGKWFHGPGEDIQIEPSDMTYGICRGCYLSTPIEPSRKKNIKVHDTKERVKE